MAYVPGWIRNNIRMHMFVQQIRRAFPGRNEREYRRFIRSISRIDSISDINMFREAIDPILKRESLFSTTFYGAESSFYGYYDEIIHYSGRKIGRIPLIPMFEHGVRFASPMRKYDRFGLSYACQSSNRVREIHAIDPWKLIFVFGPYIHYARDAYNQQQFCVLKKRLGKVLLVFPAHTCEEDTFEGSNEGFAKRVLRKYAAKYDTILVCMYWKNVNDPVAKAFEAAGAKIVSAGFRGDRSFVRRLKTIIRLADDVVVDDIGTNIGFCMYMKKQVFFEGGDQPVGEDAMFAENYRLFKRAFSLYGEEFSQEQLIEQNRLYTRFWGGDQALITREQAYKIFEALEKIYKKARYRINQLPDAEKSFLNECKDCEQKRLIENALSPEIKKNSATMN